MYQDIILQNTEGERFYTEAPNKLWDKLDMSQPVMEDCPFERETNQIFVDRAFGDVLIGGLGIGLIIKAIEEKPEVTSITIIEKYEEVIDLILSQVPFSEKVIIIQGDVFTYTPTQQYDTIWLDVWTTGKESTELGETAHHDNWKERMTQYLKVGGYIEFWTADEVDYQNYLKQYAVTS